jgi:hypothetical protein
VCGVVFVSGLQAHDASTRRDDADAPIGGTATHGWNNEHSNRTTDTANFNLTARSVNSDSDQPSDLDSDSAERTAAKSSSGRDARVSAQSERPNDHPRVTPDLGFDIARHVVTGDEPSSPSNSSRRGTALGSSQSPNRHGHDYARQSSIPSSNGQDHTHVISVPIDGNTTDLRVTVLDLRIEVQRLEGIISASVLCCACHTKSVWPHADVHRVPILNISLSDRTDLYLCGGDCRPFAYIRTHTHHTQV